MLKNGQPSVSEAARFNRLASSFLSGLEFELINSPERGMGPYGASQAVYKSSRGFFLQIGFDPVDGKYATISCGRRWQKLPRGTHYSHWLCVLAKRFGLDLPECYTLGYGDECDRAMETILADLKKTLPAILDRVTLDDLVSIEQQKFGAQELVESFFGPDYLRQVEISTFQS